eukprot:Nk52_evm12s675 gene=Nk52_evmTU12s675
MLFLLSLVDQCSWLLLCLLCLCTIPLALTLYGFGSIFIYVSFLFFSYFTGVNIIRSFLGWDIFDTKSDSGGMIETVFGALQLPLFFVFASVLYIYQVDSILALYKGLIISVSPCYFILESIVILEAILSIGKYVISILERLGGSFDDDEEDSLEAYVYKGLVLSLSIACFTVSIVFLYEFYRRSSYNTDASFVQSSYYSSVGMFLIVILAYTIYHPEGVILNAALVSLYVTYISWSASTSGKLYNGGECAIEDGITKCTDMGDGLVNSNGEGVLLLLWGQVVSSIPQLVKRATLYIPFFWFINSALDLMNMSPFPEQAGMGAIVDDGLFAFLPIPLSLVARIILQGVFFLWMSLYIYYTMQEEEVVHIDGGKWMRLKQTLIEHPLLKYARESVLVLLYTVVVVFCMYPGELYGEELRVGQGMLVLSLYTFHLYYISDEDDF